MFPEQDESKENEVDFDKSKIQYKPIAGEEELDSNPALSEIDKMAFEQNQITERQIEEQEKEPVDEKSLLKWETR